MRRQLVALAIVLFAVDVLAEKPKFTSSWRSPEASGVTFAGKKVAALVITSDEHLRVAGEEGLARELVSRVQRLRKELGFAVSDRVTLSVGGPVEIQEAVKAFQKWIAFEVLALRVTVGERMLNSAKPRAW